MSRQAPTAQEDHLDDFLDELDTAGIEVGEEDLQEDWNELDSVEEVVSLPGTSSKTTPVGGTPAGSSRSDSPPVATPGQSSAEGAPQPQKEQAQPGRAGTTAAPKAAAAAANPPRAAPAPKPPLSAPAAARPAAAAQRSASGSAAAAQRPAAVAPRTALPTKSAATAGAADGGAGAAKQPAGKGTKAPASSAGAVSKAPAPRARAAASQPRPVAAAEAAASTSAAPPAAEPSAAATQPAFSRSDTPFPRHLAAAAAKLKQPAGGAQQGAMPAALPEEEPLKEAEEEQGEAEVAQKEELEGQGSGGGRGWGGWGGAFGSLGAKLTAAVKDVTELTESFQQVLQEIATEEEVVEEEQASTSAGASASGASGSASRSTSASALQAQPAAGAQQAKQQEGRQAEAAGPEEEELSEEEAARRQQVLARLEGEESALARSVKAMDQHVEQLENRAGKALSSLWGWGAKVAQRVEAAASTAAKELAETVQEASPAWGSGASGITDAGKPAEGLGLSERLGQLGRTARGFLESGLQGAAGRQGSRSGKQDEVLSFDECFHIYGGEQAFEELEALSNECARLCNRVRAKLPDDDKANLDKVLALLAPMFDLSAERPADAAGAEGSAAAPAEPATLARGHAVIADVAAAGCARADTMAHSAAQKVEELLTTPPAPVAEEGAAAEATEPPAGEGSSAEPAPEPPVASAPSAAASSEGAGAAAVTQAVAEQREPSPAAVKALKGIQAEGVKRVAEVGSVCIERLQALARSLSAQFRFGRPADDGIAWPAAPEATALLLRGQAKKMLADLDAVAESFVSALLSTGRALNARSEHKVFAKLAEELAAELSRAPAGAKLQEAFKAMMYVVWLGSVDRELVE